MYAVFYRKGRAWKDLYFNSRLLAVLTRFVLRRWGYPTNMLTWEEDERGNGGWYITHRYSKREKKFVAV